MLFNPEWVAFAASSIFSSVNRLIVLFLIGHLRSSYASKNPRAVSINHRIPGSGMVMYPIALLPALSATDLKLFHHAAGGRVTRTNFASGYNSMSSGRKSMAVTSVAPAKPEKASSSAFSNCVRSPSRLYRYI